MKAQEVKGNSPELPVDYNGNAIQAWTIGGRTIEVESNEFTAESSVIRVCTGNSLARIKLKARYSEDKDSGMPIPPNTVMCLGCEPGDVFEVEGSLSVTFVRERDFTMKSVFNLIPSQISWSPDELGGLECECEIEGNTAKFSGYIDYYYNFPKNGNRVGIMITPELNVEEYPNLVVTLKENGETYSFNKSVFVKGDDNKYSFIYKFLVSRKLEKLPIVIDWTGKGDIETFYVEITDKAVLRNG